MNSTTKCYTFFGFFLLNFVLYLFLPNFSLFTDFFRSLDIFAQEHANFIFIMISIMALAFALTELTAAGLQVLKKVGRRSPKIGKILVSQGIITHHQLYRALREQNLKMGEILVQGGRITPQQRNQALKYQRKQYRKIGKILKELGYSTEEDIRWGELAIFKRAYFIAVREKHPSKMLMCSMRLSPKMQDGTTASWHLEKVAGGDIVYTCPPPFIHQIMVAEDQFKSINAEAIHESPPRSSIDKLMQLPYFVQAYEPEGMQPEQFNRFGPLVATLAEFSAATRGMVDFVARQFQALGKLTPEGKTSVELLWPAAF